ncbi:hypothetical protein J3459_018055 [Metarhizium acridum]|uniref:uncharacterized protein n=1 Tax=Metarhizium acridum TaxID=92637 RepID=UPI001C6B07B8|nr:hypothetical protein J3459_018055 [Metarhizium acridum]KAG8410249.1 hypothetical protein J3458_017965 [Metarhizium acridum]
MHLGSGDSVIPVELASRGYKRQLCIDFSPTVVDLMTGRHAEVEGIEWDIDIQVLDDPGSFDYYGYMLHKEGTR